jgi:hypothetical protein
MNSATKKTRYRHDVGRKMRLGSSKIPGLEPALSSISRRMYYIVVELMRSMLLISKNEVHRGPFVCTIAPGRSKALKGMYNM